MKAMERLLQFVGRLQDAKIQHDIKCVHDAIMVSVVAPSTYFEIEFFADGEIEVQTFVAGEVESVTLDEITKTVFEAFKG